MRKVIIVSVSPDGEETRKVISRHFTKRAAEKARLDYGIKNGFAIVVDGITVLPQAAPDEGSR